MFTLSGCSRLDFSEIEELDFDNVHDNVYVDVYDMKSVSGFSGELVLIHFTSYRFYYLSPKSLPKNFKPLSCNSVNA